MLENQKPPCRCPRCGCDRIAKNGRRKNGTQKWKCRNPDCPDPYFDDWTGTCFSSCKLPDEKIRLLLSMTFEDCLEEQICNVVGLSSRTAYVWRLKIYDVASRFVASKGMLSGKVWFDETFVSVNASQLILRDGRRLRGISGNQVAICAGIDSSGNRFAEVAGKGHPRGARCLQVYSKHVTKGSHIVHDDFRGHERFAEWNGGEEDVWPTKDPGSLRAMQPINSFHSSIQRKFVVHIGMLTEYVQMYLDWLVFETYLDEVEPEEKIAFFVDANRRVGGDFKVKHRY